MGLKELDDILNGGLHIPSALLIIGDVGTVKVFSVSSSYTYRRRRA